MLNDTVYGKVNGVGHRKDEGGSSGNIWGMDANATEFGW
jgi:hypothetical protein